MPFAIKKNTRTDDMLKSILTIYKQIKNYPET